MIANNLKKCSTSLLLLEFGILYINIQRTILTDQDGDCFRICHNGIQDNLGSIYIISLTNFCYKRMFYFSIPPSVSTTNINIGQSHYTCFHFCFKLLNPIISGKYIPDETIPECFMHSFITLSYTLVYYINLCSHCHVFFLFFSVKPTNQMFTMI